MNNNIKSMKSLNHIAFLEENPHKVDLINYLHDLNERVKHHQNIEIFVRDNDDEYCRYVKTLIDKVRCHRTYRFKKTEFDFYGFGLMLMNDAIRFYNNYDIMFEDGDLFVDNIINNVTVSYYVNDVRLFIHESNNKLYYYEMTIDEYKNFKNKRNQSYMLKDLSKLIKKAE